MSRGLWNVHIECKTEFSIVKRIKSANNLNKVPKAVMFSCFPFKRSNNCETPKEITKKLFYFHENRNYYDSYGCGLSQ